MMKKSVREGRLSSQASYKALVWGGITSLLTLFILQISIHRCLLPSGFADSGFNPDEALCYGERGKGQKVLVYSDTVQSTNSTEREAFNQSLPLNLKHIQKKTGIQFSAIKDIDEAKKELATGTYDAFWLIDTNREASSLTPDFFEVLRTQVDRGMGLILNTENEPYFVLSNHILSTLKPEWNIQIMGNDQGEQTIARDTDGVGRLMEHPISSGIYHNISEGVTISYVAPKNSSSTSVLTEDYFLEVVKNSSGNISVSSIEEPLSSTNSLRTSVPKNQSNEPVLRVVLHGGFTSLFRSEFMGEDPLTNQWAWDSKLSPATPMFFENIACYAVGK